MNKYEICYRVLNSTDTEWHEFTARNREEAMRIFRQGHPHNIVLAKYENGERI